MQPLNQVALQRRIERVEHGNGGFFRQQPKDDGALTQCESLKYKHQLCVGQGRDRGCERRKVFARELLQDLGG